MSQSFFVYFGWHEPDKFIEKPYQLTQYQILTRHTHDQCERASTHIIPRTLSHKAHQPHHKEPTLTRHRQRIWVTHTWMCMKNMSIQWKKAVSHPTNIIHIIYHQHRKVCMGLWLNLVFNALLNREVGRDKYMFFGLIGCTAWFWCQSLKIVVKQEPTTLQKCKKRIKITCLLPSSMCDLVAPRRDAPLYPWLAGGRQSSLTMTTDTRFDWPMLVHTKSHWNSGTCHFCGANNRAGGSTEAQQWQQQPNK